MLDNTATSTALSFKDWYRKPYRLIQTNLRQMDVLYDQRALAREAREFGATALLYNIGGIYAFYPSKLELQLVNPVMEGDALGAAIEAAHAEGLSLIGRFDVSKASKKAYDAHPEWFARGQKGEPLEYNGTYQACVNGGWYQDYAFRIIEEALSQYDVDGVFFNMFGYRNSNYSGQSFGLCRCENCQRRFREMYGQELPKTADFSDPAYADYLEFQDRTALDLQVRIYEHVHKVSPQTAMFGRRGKRDVLRWEVQRAIERPLPEWPYQSGEQARYLRALGPDQMAASTSANFIDFAWRFHSETAAYNELRFAQQLGVGATLDLYLLGVLDQADKSALPRISELFHWHRGVEGHYENLRSAATVGLYHSFKTERFRSRNGTPDPRNTAFRGAYRALLEARIPFDFVLDEKVEAEGGGELLDRYDALVLPSVTCLSDAEAAVLDAFVRGGGTLLTTGDSALCGPKGELREAPALDCLPIAGMPVRHAPMKGAYLTFGEGDLPLPGTRLMMLDGEFLEAPEKAGAERLMRLLPPQRFGPPELCFPEEESDLPGVLSQDYGAGRAVWLPWNPDRQYYRDSLPAHRTLIADLVTRNSPPMPARLTGLGHAEVTVQAQPATGTLKVHVINYAGQRGNLYEDPPKLTGLKLGLRGVAGEAAALVSGQTVASSGPADADGYLWFDLPPVGAFEVLSIATA
ncbi:alpha-amylase family protein [Celeribacter indicus]|uniref:Uncharacterized protein n=1 Tax=Celeribacter indicus TaxID=1208324 RepID=A0A0B5E438_9RHOB|nr:alpha-amylase family protein [Celeribacter indicus]AJE47821.1 hypothetical protein P73_3106 [Celeribacter indicus]SDW23992.1 Beta-galactosidase trimerisation domain-containing protein [Celeribacter indicus]